jgi:hypothetical protein
MMNLNEIRDLYLAEGFSYLEANSRTSQDIVLSLISKSTLISHITIKGGVLMQHLSGDGRRATQDFDLDFIRHSLSDTSVINFVEKLSGLTDEIDVTINAPIEALKHQDYNGKRAYIRITDSTGTSIDTKLDIGVHKNTNIEQGLFCFELRKLDDSVSLLANTKEQMFAEKLKSLLRLGASSTRYKDVFDMYWIVEQGEINKTILHIDLKLIIFDDETMRENCIIDIVSRLDRVFKDPHFTDSLSKSRRHNWLDVKIEKALNDLLDFFTNFE